LEERNAPEAIRKQLYSLASFLSDNPTTSLPLSLVSLLNRDGQPTRSSTASHVVVSTALHANLLKTAEELRSSIEGVARFKEAAQRNIGIFHSATARLLPASRDGVRLYSPGKRNLHKVKPDSDGAVTIQGPFAYFLATTSVDRLEPDPPFLISPLVKRIPLKDGEVDVIVVRPSRDPVVQAAIGTPGRAVYGADWDGLDTGLQMKAAAAWPARAMSSVGRAYGKGEHVDLVYSTSATSGEENGEHVLAAEGDERESVVEVYRCGGWEWTPLVSSLESFAGRHES
jgi:hypothetical protein